MQSTTERNEQNAQAAQNAGLCWRSVEALLEVGALRQYLDACKPHDARTARLAGSDKRAPQPRVRVNLAVERLAVSEVRAVAKAAPAVDLFAKLQALAAT